MVVALVGAIFALALVVSGCGGGSSEAELLTKSEFVAEANEICTEADEERKQGTDDLVESGDDEADRAEALDAVAEALVVPVRTMSEELAELSPPKGQGEQANAIVAAYDDAVAELEADPTSPEAAIAFEKANDLARDFGLTDCTV